MTPKYHSLPWLRRITVGALLFFAGHLLAQDSSRGTLTGRVSNAVSNDMLPSAIVEIPALGRSAFVDTDGYYYLRDLPSGTHTVVARYTGLDDARESVEIPASGGLVTKNFELTSKVYELPAFKVASEAEGNAASINRQRNASNLTNIVAIDAFGSLPNMSVGELATRIPGIAGTTDDGGEINGLVVRGTPNDQNRYTIDGLPMIGSAGLTREVLPNTLNVAMFDEMEVSKGTRPDQNADSLGATIDVKTRSPLSLKGRRQITYNIGARWAPPFFEHISARRAHPIHPLINLTYQGVYDAFGGKRNLGIMASGFYSENVVVYNSTQYSYANTTDPAYIYSFTSRQATTYRMQTAGNVRVDYRLSPRSKFSANFVYNYVNNPFNRHFTVGATTNQTVATLDSSGQPTGTGTIMPGSNEWVTTVRPLSGSFIQLNSIFQRFHDARRSYNFGGEHKFGPITIDYQAAYTRTRTRQGGESAGDLALRATSVGWILDRTESNLHPVFTQTAGPDLSTIASYSVRQLNTTQRVNRIADVLTFKGNASYDGTFADRHPYRIKVGAERRNQGADARFFPRRWNYIGNKSDITSPPDPGYPLSDTTLAGRNLIYYDVATQLQDDAVKNPASWSPDVYYMESEKRRLHNMLDETISAAYAQFQGSFSKFSYLGGVRFERTQTEVRGITRARVLSTTAQQTADPVGSALRDYPDENLRINTADYTDAFPSVHLTYDFTKRLKARASWSTSIGRPPFSSLRPVETPNETTEVLTVNNPDLKPQHSKNTDLALEYYFEPVGLLSVGWFNKNIDDYIVSNLIGGIIGSGPDNGYGGQYAGWETRSAGNAGTAKIQGWEFSYQQQFTFLPGALKGLGAQLNYTVLKTHGDYGGTSIVGTDQVDGFIPRTANASLSYRYANFSTRILYSYRSSYLNALSSSAALNEYYYSRETVNLNVSYRLRPQVSLSIDISNLFNEPVSRYRYSPDRPSLFTSPGTTINVAVTGRF